MNRIEAFRALFGDDADNTASLEAVRALGDSPRPSAAEEQQLADDDLIDRANDFADRPGFYVSGLSAGNVKTILDGLVTTLSAPPAQAPAAPAAGVITAAAAPQAPAAPAAQAAPAVVVDPRDALLAAAVNAPAEQPQGRQEVGRAPQRQRQEVVGAGQANGGRQRRGRDNRPDQGRDDQDNQPARERGDRQGRRRDVQRGRDDRRLDPPPPKPPAKTTIAQRQIMATREWFATRTGMEILFVRVRAADPDALEEVRVRVHFLESMLKSGNFTGREKIGFRFLLKLIEALRDRIDELDVNTYNERFVDGRSRSVTAPAAS